MKVFRSGWLRAAIVLIVVAGAAHHYYPRLKAWRLIQMADRAREQGQIVRAVHIYHQARGLDPGSVRAVRGIAQTLFLWGHPRAIFWYARWAQMDPDNPVARLELGKLSVLRNDLENARTALESARRLGGSPSGLVELEAAIRVREGRKEDALLLLDEFLSKHGGNESLEFLRATLQLSSSEESTRGRGEQMLTRMMGSEEYRDRAATQLISYKRRHGALEEAREMTWVLLQRNPDAHQHARLLWLMDREALDGDVTRDLKLFQAQVTRHPQWLPGLVKFFHKNGAGDDAVALMEGLPDSVMKSAPGYLSWAIHLEAVGDWDQIGETLSDQDWGALSCLRLAYLLESRRRNGDLTLRSHLLGLLNLEVRGDVNHFFQVDQLARKWNWKDERISMWEACMESLHLTEGMLRNLLADADARKDTVGLYVISGALMKRMADDPVVVNNHVTYALLLNREVELQLERAGKNLELMKDSDAALSTYALALLKNGRVADALAAVREISQEGRSRPAIAFYVELVRKANGDPAGEGKQPARYGVRDQDLLAEEIALYHSYQ